MRPRFLFLSGMGVDRRDAVARRLRLLLPEQRSCGDDSLFVSRDCPVIDLPAIGGWVVGRLFSSDGRDRHTMLPGPEQLAIMSGSGRSLIERHSGAYVALWRGCGAAPLTVLRDPSACLPAYVHRRDDMVLVASDVECILHSGLVGISIDPRGISEYLRFPTVPSSRTCLAGIVELRPGFVTTVGASIEARAVWIPREVAGRRQADAAALAETIDGVVAGECAGHSRPGIELSGGLDSSIVTAAIVAERHPQVLHMVPEAQDADERRFARLVVDRYGLDLSEIPIPFENIDLGLRPARLTARPTNTAHFSVINEKLRVARAAVDAYPMFSGGGGDSVFCSVASTGLILDAWRDRGWSGARETLGELAVVAGVTQGEALRHLARRIAKGTVVTRKWTPDRQLLGPGAVEDEPPDASQLEGLSPGLRGHVASVLRMQTLLDAHDRAATDDLRFPLMAQPVMEACFSVRSWQWVGGGRDRSVARDAFADRLPSEIVHRRGKGRYDTFTARAIDRSRSMVRETLLGGWLAEHRLIDQSAVEAAIASPVTATSTIHERVINLLEAEYWCRLILDRQGEAGAR